MSNTGRIAIDDNEALRKFGRWRIKVLGVADYYHPWEDIS
jgi:hypothetical protein